MGFNRRKMEDQRREAANKEAAKRRATDAQVLEDAERLIAAWNERQALRAPMIFSPMIGARLTSARTSCPMPIALSVAGGQILTKMERNPAGGPGRGKKEKPSTRLRAFF